MSDAQIREWDSALTRCAALLVRSSYRDDISDEDADMLRDAVSRATRARDGLITRLRAAEARAAWADSLALQAHSMATAIDQADEDGGLGALGPVTAAIIRSDVARMLEIVAERPAAPEAP